MRRAWGLGALVALLAGLIATKYLISDGGTPEPEPATPTACESLDVLRREADFYVGYIEANIGVEESSRHEADTYPPNSRMNPRDEIEIRRRLKSTGAFYAFQTARASFGDLGEMTFEQAGMLVGYMYHQGILDRYAGIDAITDHYAGVDAAIDHALAAHGCDP